MIRKYFRVIDNTKNIQIVVIAIPYWIVNKNVRISEILKYLIVGAINHDIIAANNSGIFNTILVRSGHKINESSSKAKFILDSIIDSKKVIIS